MPFTTEQIQRAATYALATYQREALARSFADSPRSLRKGDDTAALLRSQYIGFGLMVAIVCVAGYAVGQWIGVW